MQRRALCGGIGAVAGLWASGCGLLSTKTVVSSSRSLRLEDGYFFGHDLRQNLNVEYVLDLSGSMSERSGTVVEQVGKDAAAHAGGSLLSAVGGNTLGSAAEETVLSMDRKVEVVKDHLLASLRGLPADAHFNIVLFSDGVQHLSPTSLPANGVATTLVSAFVSRLGTGGSTSLKSAIAAALEDDATELLILTDGLPTDSSPDSILEMVRSANADGSRRISTVGVGSDQARDFLTRLATDNGGSYTAYES